MAINKSEFITYYAEKNEITKKQAMEEVERFVDTFKYATIEKDGVNILGFMKTEIAHRDARDGVNPLTGKPITIAAKDFVKVKLSKNFKNMEIGE